MIERGSTLSHEFEPITIDEALDRVWNVLSRRNDTGRSDLSSPDCSSCATSVDLSWAFDLLSAVKRHESPPAQDSPPVPEEPPTEERCFHDDPDSHDFEFKLILFGNTHVYVYECRDCGRTLEQIKPPPVKEPPSQDDPPLQNDPLPALESHLREHGRLLVPGSRKDYMLLYLTRIVLALARSNRHWYSEYVRLTTEEE